MEIENNDVLIHAIKSYSVVSFDIFDTLIVRNVDRPIRIFEIVERRYVQIYSKEVSGFATQRINAERSLRSKIIGEISLDDIYAVLSSQYDCETIKQLKNLELMVELDFCQANNKLKQVFNFCLEENKKIILISDMYLPKSFIERMLHKCGYNGYLELYLSSDYKKTKSEGSLYEVVLQEQEILPSQLIHIGDNAKSDIKRAKKHGISAVHVKTMKHPSNRTELKRKTNLDLIIKESVIANNTQDNFDIFQKVGYEDFGPLLFGFLKWVKEQTDKNDCKKILFLSRDGYLMKRAFEVLYPEMSERIYYFYASRRALQVANICNQHGFEEVVSTMFFPRVFKISWLIKRLGLAPENCKNEIILSGIQEDEDINGKNVLSNERVKKLFYLLEKQIIENSKKENLAFKKYIESLGFDGNTAFVDIGWHGNMQNAFETMIKSASFHINVFGLYLGLDPESQYQNIYNMQGYLYQRGKNEELYYQSKYICSLLELFFMAPHGSTKKYAWNECGLEIIKDDFEYEGTTTAEKMFRLQDAAIIYVQITKALINYISSAELEAFNGVFSRFMNPTLSIADSFGDLEIWDDKWVKVAQKDSLKDLRSLKHNFAHASWKMGYLKRLLKLPLPYCDLVLTLKKLSGR